MKPKIADFAVILLVLILAALCAVPLFFLRSGSNIEITANGNVYTLPLSGDASEIITSNGHTLTVEIRDGAACISEHTCPDGLCAAMGSIKRPGETLICLPAKVLIRVSGETDGVPDGIAG